MSSEYSLLPASEIRQLCRGANFTSPTAGLCQDQVQANLLILPLHLAADFRRLCLRNPVPCPLLGEGKPGERGFPLHLQLQEAQDLGDVTTDAPRYNVYRDGVLIGSKVDCRAEWEEMQRHGGPVAFYIGCSFSFEKALADAGLTPRHVREGRNVAMYRTTIPLLPSGVFGGHAVVSMRPYRIEDIETVRKITSRFVLTHGEPIAWGFDATIRLGIDNLAKPDFGDDISILEGEVPVFWGCGVTPQIAVMQSGVQGLIVGHTPGHMLCLDIGPESVCDSRS